MHTHIFDLLKADHKKVKAILEQLSETTEVAVKTREALFKKLVEALRVHEEFEEAFFYPKVEKETKNPDTKDLVEEAYQEHHIVDILLAEMKKLSVQDKVWTAKLTVLKESIAHHVQEEENELFPKAQKTLTAPELDSMATQFIQSKKDAK